MNNKEFQSRLKVFSNILHSCGTAPKKFIFDSIIYVDGIRESVGEVRARSKSGTKLLDLGCGTGLTSFLFSRLGYKVEGLDVDLNNKEKIQEFKDKSGLQRRIWKKLEKENIRIQFYDGLHIPFKSNSFDSVVAHAVIEHIPPKNLLPVIKEIRRVLKDNGQFYIFRTPRKKSYAEHLARTLGFGTHEILMDEKEIVKLLEKHGFVVINNKKTDLVLGSMPGSLQDILNYLAIPLLYLDKLLLNTPLSVLAHHMQIISVKVGKIKT